MAGKKTWLKKRVEKMEDDPFWKWVLYLYFFIPVITGIVGLVVLGYKGYHFFADFDESETRISVQVVNHLAQPIIINSICKFDVNENQSGTSISYTGFGPFVSLLPVGSTTGTNLYFLKAGQKKDYFFRFPENQQGRDLMTRGSGTITLHVPSVFDGFQADGQILFEKNNLRHSKMLVDFKKD